VEELKVLRSSTCGMVGRRAHEIRQCPCSAVKNANTSGTELQAVLCPWPGSGISCGLTSGKRHANMGLDLTMKGPRRVPYRKPLCDSGLPSEALRLCYSTTNFGPKLSS